MNVIHKHNVSKKLLATYQPEDTEAWLRDLAAVFSKGMELTILWSKPGSKSISTLISTVTKHKIVSYIATVTCGKEHVTYEKETSTFSSPKSERVEWKGRDGI